MFLNCDTEDQDDRVIHKDFEWDAGKVWSEPVRYILRYHSDIYVENLKKAIKT